MFSPEADALDLSSRCAAGRLLQTPLQDGTWALLEPAGRQNHAPQLCWLDQNRLACIWMAGGQEGTAGMSIYLSELRRGRARWSKPRLISQDPDRSEQNPLLFVTADGRVQLIHTAQRARDPGDHSWQSEGTTFSMQWTAALRRQSRPCIGGRWSRATDLLKEPAFCRHPPYRREDGHWLLPIYRSLESGGAFGHDHSEVLLLKPDGSPVGEIFPVPESTGRVHGSIVLSRDGDRLLQFFRSRLADRIYRSYGSLDGTNWTAPEPIALPNNNSSIQACRLVSGRLAMIYNRFCFEPDLIKPQAWGEANWPRTRWPLSIAISDDDGETWPWARDIDSGLGFCGTANWHLNGQLAYPSLIEGRPGELHLAYSWGGRAAIRYVCLEEATITGEAVWPW
jgi:predicted neuraminidase